MGDMNTPSKKRDAMKKLNRSFDELRRTNEKVDTEQAGRIEDLEKRVEALEKKKKKE